MNINQLAYYLSRYHIKLIIYIPLMGEIIKTIKFKVL